MIKHLSVLDDFRIAYPCPKQWEDMAGDERVRFCPECKLNVYNFAALSRAEAEALVIEKEGRLCGRIYRRADGTVITRNCPLSLYLLKRKVAKWGAAIVAVFVVLLEVVGFARAPRCTDGTPKGTNLVRLRELQPFKAVYDKFAPNSIVPTRPVFLVGRMAPPTNIGKVRGPEPVAGKSSS